MGIAVEQLTPELRRQYKLESRTGLVVVEVDQGSLAQRAGIREGDVLLEINRVKVNGIAELDKAIGRVSKSITLLIDREGKTFFVSFKTE